ncbi:MAG: hypothetical protein AAB332_00460 [Planctomycetota bacterium]
MESGTLNREYVPNFVEVHKSATDGTNGNHTGFKPKVQAGILRYGNQKYFVKPCEMARVERSLLPVNPYPPPQDRNPNAVPPWHLQHKQVIVQLEPVAKWQFHKAQYKTDPKTKGKKLIHPDLYLWYRKVISIRFGNMPSSPDEVSGILVLSGNIQRKHMEFVFIPKGVSPLKLKNDVVEILEDKDQLTGWQENAFPKDCPNKDCRAANGHLRDGEPIFYLLNDIVSIGRAQMFRLPYKNSTQEFVPKELKSEDELDLSEAIFGTVKKKGKKSIKGRLFFEDAEWNNKEITSPFFDG